jgi:hypothetical protein
MGPVGFIDWLGHFVASRLLGIFSASHRRSVVNGIKGNVLIAKIA